MLLLILSVEGVLLVHNLLFQLLTFVASTLLFAICIIMFLSLSVTATVTKEKSHSPVLATSQAQSSSSNGFDDFLVDMPSTTTGQPQLTHGAEEGFKRYEKLS